MVIWTNCNEVLQPEETSVGLLLAAIAAISLLLGSVIMRILTPIAANRFGIIAGVNSILLVAVLKSLGSRVAAWLKAATPDEKNQRGETLTVGRVVRKFGLLLIGIMFAAPYAGRPRSGFGSRACPRN